jgi:hypothetical protein
MKTDNKTTSIKYILPSNIFDRIHELEGLRYCWMGEPSTPPPQGGARQVARKESQQARRDVSKEQQQAKRDAQKQAQPAAAAAQ